MAWIPYRAPRNHSRWVFSETALVRIGKSGRVSFNHAAERSLGVTEKNRRVAIYINPDINALGFRRYSERDQQAGADGRQLSGKNSNGPRGFEADVLFRNIKTDPVRVTGEYVMEPDKAVPDLYVIVLRATDEQAAA